MSEIRREFKDLSNYRKETFFINNLRTINNVDLEIYLLQLSHKCIDICFPNRVQYLSL